MRLDHEATPVRVNQRMTFAPVDLLAGIITARAASLRGLDALAVDDRGRRTGFAPDPLAIRYHQRMVDLLEQAGIAPGCKPAIDRAPGRKVLRQLAPRTARAHHVENAVDDLAATANRAGGRCPWRAADTARSRAIPHRSHRSGSANRCGYSSCGWLGSTWHLRIGVSNRSESRRLQSLNPFETAS